MKTDVSFAAVAREYRVIFFDAYGVLRNSRGIIEGVPDVLAGLTADGVLPYVITNDASKSPDVMVKSYNELIPRAQIVSSGMLAAEFLAVKVPEDRRSVAYLGQPPSVYYIESAGCTALPIAEVTDAHQLGAVAFMDDEGFDWFLHLNETLNILREVNVPVIVANTDASYPVNSRRIAVAVGSLATMIEGILGRTFVRFGKPDTQIFSFAYARAKEILPGVKKSEILMVGDTLHTDILGANQFGIDTALVLSGNTLKEKARMQIRSSGIIPTYMFDSIMT